MASVALRERSWAGVLAGLLLSLALAGGAVAQGPERRLLGPQEAQAFRGVGRLNVADARFCTATLIGPRLVVTAAHCLYHPRSGRRVPVDALRFVAGQRIEEIAALRNVVRAVVAEGFELGAAPTPEGLAADLALLELDAEIAPQDAPPFETGVFPDGAGSTVIVSYARDRAQAPSIQRGCRRLLDLGGVAVMNCAVKSGASGAPVFAGRGRDRRLVAVVSAMGALEPIGDFTLAVRLTPHIDRLRDALAAAAR